MFELTEKGKNALFTFDEEEIMYLVECYVMATIRCYEATKDTYGETDKIRNKCREELRKALNNAV